MRTNDTSKNLVLMLAFCGLCVIVPVFLLLGAVLLYKHKVSYVLLLLFSLYFGWQYEPQMDLLTHYQQFLEIADMSLATMWADPSTAWVGEEVYPVLFKYTIATISKSPNVFSALACFSYTAVFCLFLSTLRPIYSKKMDLLQLMLFVGVVFVVEYVWFLGLRYWAGVFVFLYGYLLHIQKQKNIYLLICVCAVGFHFSHLTLLFTLFLSKIIKGGKLFIITLVLLSFVFRILQLDLLFYFAEKLSIWGYAKESFLNVDRVEGLIEYIRDFRSGANIFYLYRSELLLTGAILTYIQLRKHVTPLNRYSREFRTFLFILFCLANFGFVEISFYDRFLKVVVLGSYIYLFLHYRPGPSVKSGKRALLLLPFVAYALVSVAIEQREYLTNMNLWFSNW